MKKLTNKDLEFVSSDDDSVGNTNAQKSSNKTYKHIKFADAQAEQKWRYKLLFGPENHESLIKKTYNGIIETQSSQGLASDLQIIR